MTTSKYIQIIENIIKQHKNLTSNNLDRVVMYLNKLHNTSNYKSDIIKLLTTINDLYTELYISNENKLSEGKFLLCIIPGLGGSDTEDLANIMLHTYHKSFKFLGLKCIVNTDNLYIEFYDRNYFNVINKTENVLYKIIRNSPFCDKVQTSFIRVVILSVKGKINIDQIINSTSFTYSKASSKGGQHANKTSSVVKARHKITGLYATASDSRKQADNKKIATQRIIQKVLQTTSKEEQEYRKKLILASGPTSFGALPDRIIDANKGKFVKDRITSIKYHLPNIDSINITELIYDTITYVMNQ